MSGVLGCAEEYTAIVHWRGGGRVFAGPLKATSVQWGRTANDTSEAEVAIVKSGAAGCGADLGRIEPWVHELTVYRDGALVWQGPVVKVTERSSVLVVEAQDAMAWLERLTNTWLMRFKTDMTDPNRKPGPVTKIAETILKLNLNDPLSTPADYPGLLPYVVRRDTSTVISFEADGDDSQKTIWTETVAGIWQELVKRNLLYTTVGRSLVLRGRAGPAAVPLARLTLDDFLGDVEVIKDGTATATMAFATSQDGQTLSGRLTQAVGYANTPYGRLDSIVRVQNQNADADELKETAWDHLDGRYPTPVVLRVPDGSQLSPRAPLRIEELVCGERIDVVNDGYLMPASAALMLSDVAVSWAANGGEKVSISLVPLVVKDGAP